MADTATNKELALLQSRIADLTEQCRDHGYPAFLGFLDAAQQSQAAQLLKYAGCTHCFWGGYPDAERVYLGVYPDTETDRSLFPFRCLAITFRLQDALSHRDFLGSLMALGLRRDAVGDICVEAGRAVVFLADHAAQLVLRELDKVGSTGVELAECPMDSLQFTRSFLPVTGTVASLRIDCVVAMLCNLSRTQASRLITTGLVAINGLAVPETTKTIVVGDKISIRGTGKYIFDGQDGVSRKDKLRLRFSKYQ